MCIRDRLQACAADRRPRVRERGARPLGLHSLVVIMEFMRSGLSMLCWIRVFATGIRYHARAHTVAASAGQARVSLVAVCVHRGTVNALSLAVLLPRSRLGKGHKSPRPCRAPRHTEGDVVSRSATHGHAGSHPILSLSLSPSGGHQRAAHCTRGAQAQSAQCPTVSPTSNM